MKLSTIRRPKDAVFDKQTTATTQYTTLRQRRKQQILTVL